MAYDLTYQRADGPSGGPAEGTRRLADHIEQLWPETANWGIYNPRRVRGSTTTWSIHAEGRAIDVAIPLDAAGEDTGNEIAAWLIDNATTLGCQFFIWNGRSWRPDRGWRTYSGTSPHRDHIHLEQTRLAAATWTPEVPTMHVDNVIDPHGQSDTAGRTPFWSVTADGGVTSHNGARPTGPDLTTFDLASPIDGAEYHAGQLVLTASGDGGTFALNAA
jgi:hypothetical protein